VAAAVGASAKCKPYEEKSAAPNPKIPIGAITSRKLRVSRAWHLGRIDCHDAPDAADAGAAPRLLSMVCSVSAVCVHCEI
jgi:hypothetical protein